VMVFFTYLKRPCIILIFLFINVGAFAFTDQATSERILRENKHFIEFINISITNFSEDKKGEFRDVYEKHFNADVAYLQSDYKRAFKRLYSSQGEMSKIFESILKDKYLEDSKNILDKIAPEIIRSKNSRARLYLTLGYRDRTVSWTHYTIGEASNPKLYSYKLYKYEEGIKMARRAKRYGFLALFESQKPEVKRKIYHFMLKGEMDTGNRFFNRFLGISEDEYYKQIGVSYEEYEKKLDEKEKSEDAVFEKKVERRVRFRNELRTAKFLLDTDFDRAEDIIRRYVDDFNYKLISSTFQVLSAEKTAESGAVDYKDLQVHLLDNYQRLSKASVLDGLLDSIKVEDDISKKENSDKKDETKKDDSADKKTVKENNDTEKKDNKN